LIGKNKKTIIYKCIASNGVVAGREEADAAILVVADIVACDCVVAGIADVDAETVVADIVAYNVIVAGRVEDDAEVVVVDIVAC
jgi:hypothetical protein